jgi:hypothetical protein
MVDIFEEKYSPIRGVGGFLVFFFWWRLFLSGRDGILQLKW